MNRNRIYTMVARTGFAILIAGFAVGLMAQDKCKKIEPKEPICSDPATDCAQMPPGDCPGSWTCDDFATCKWECDAPEPNECKSDSDCSPGSQCLCEPDCGWDSAAGKIIPCPLVCQCKPVEQPMGDCMSDDQCPKGTSCTAPKDCLACKSCPACAVCCGVCEPDPVSNPCVVTGCSGQICAPEDMASTCEWKPVYACYQLSNCGPYGSAGQCSWQSNPAFDECIKNGGQTLK